MKTDEQILEVVIELAKIGVPIGAALFDKNGNLLGAGDNRSY